MSENLNLTELIEQLQQIVKDGRFEYMPTNVESVKYENTMGGGFVTLDGVTPSETVEAIQRDLDRAECRADEAACDVEDLERKLRRAREKITELESKLKNP